MKAAAPTFELIGFLKIRVELFPTEKPGIDGPRPWANHRQTDPEDRQYKRDPHVIGLRESDPKLDCCRDRARHRRPQPGEYQYSSNCSEYLRNGEFEMKSLRQRQGTAVHQNSSGEDPL